MDRRQFLKVSALGAASAVVLPRMPIDWSIVPKEIPKPKPAFTFAGDTDTGMYSPRANEIRFVT